MKSISKYTTYLSLGLIPFYFFRFKCCSIPTNILEVAILLAVIFTLFGHKNLWADREKWLLPILFILASLIASLIAKDKTNAFGILKGWIVIPIILSWVVSKNFSSNELAKIALPFYMSSSLVSIWAILQKIGLITTLFYQRGDATFNQYINQGRVFGPFESPNYLAMFLVPAIFLSLPFLFSIKNNYLKISAIISLALPILAICLSESRAGLIALIGSVLISILLNLKKKIRNKLILIPLVAGILALSSAFLILNSSRIGGDNVRREIYRYSYDILKQNWFWGIGLGEFPQKIDMISKNNWSFQQWGIPFALHPHNLFLAVWLNFGLIGFAIFLIILIKIFMSLLKNKSYFAQFYLAALSAIVIHGFFDTTYFKNDLSIIFWLIFAVSILPYAPQKSITT